MQELIKYVLPDVFSVVLPFLAGFCFCYLWRKGEERDAWSNGYMFANKQINGRLFRARFEP